MVISTCVNDYFISLLKELRSKIVGARIECGMLGIKPITKNVRDFSKERYFLYQIKTMMHSLPTYVKKYEKTMIL